MIFFSHWVVMAWMLGKLSSACHSYSISAFQFCHGGSDRKKFYFLLGLGYQFLLIGLVFVIMVKSLLFLYMKTKADEV